MGLEDITIIEQNETNPEKKEIFEALSGNGKSTLETKKKTNAANHRKNIETLKTLEIKNIKKSDDEALIDLLHKFADEIRAGSYINEVFYAKFRKGAYINGKLVGFECTSPCKTVLAGKGIYVLPKYRGGSIAEKLLIETLNIAREKGLKGLELGHLQLGRAAKLDRIAAENKKTPLLKDTELVFIPREEEMNRHYNIYFKDKLSDEELKRYKKYL